MAVYRRVLLRFSHLYPQFQPASELSSQASTPPHLSPSSPLLSPSRLFAFCSADRRSLRVESPLGFTPSGLAREGTFSRCWNRQWCSTVGAILIGQAAIFLGLCNESASAHDHSVGLGATSNEQAEENAVGLQRIEDGSVISNEHTAKWRIFTDNARDFLLKASNSSPLSLCEPPFGAI
ncbi:hypothetical protein GUJ93_ZPchr0015g6864 [Zizania palustris]|uniref:Uncharacterized protein n=1 Tax=Zizania palustris TaxID=103762 RepID=A0A8J5TB49_ZIZPA|nr:hypothetical protein GUJ93_ZPchr0015g6864 [Zizania palustris]